MEATPSTQGRRHSGTRHSSGRRRAASVALWALLAGLLAGLLAIGRPIVADDAAAPLPIEYLAAEAAQADSAPSGDRSPRPVATATAADIFDNVGALGTKPPEFTDGQWDAIMQVADGGSADAENEAYYVLLERIGALRTDDAQAVTYRELVQNARQYRGRPVSMTLLYCDSVQVGTHSPRRIPSVHRTTGWAADSPRDLNAVVVVSLSAPPKMGKNDTFAVTGYFYMIQKFDSKAGGKVDVPVIIARDISVVATTSRFDAKAAITVALLVVLIVAWVLLRRRLSRPATVGRPQYRPKRFEMTDADIEKSRQSWAGEQPPSEQPPQDDESACEGP